MTALLIAFALKNWAWIAAVLAGFAAFFGYGVKKKAEGKAEVKAQIDQANQKAVTDAENDDAANRARSTDDLVKRLPDDGH